MNCRRCHHTDDVHESTDSSESIIRNSIFHIPVCTCKQFLDAFEELDDELVETNFSEE